MFKLGIILLRTKAHLNKPGFNKILSIRADFNLALSDKLQLSFREIKPVTKPLLKNTNVMDFYRISGLSSGEKL